MKEELNSKIMGIVGLYNFYKHHMNTPQRIGLLTLWMEVSVDREEYEVADALQKELNKILEGDEEYFATSPFNMIFTQPDMDMVKGKILEPINEKKSNNFKWVNLWGCNQFKLIEISFDTFILFNVGFTVRK